jgi:hypothetical protein
MNDGKRKLSSASFSCKDMDTRSIDNRDVTHVISPKQAIYLQFYIAASQCV